MTKYNIVENIYNALGLKKRDINQIVNSTFDIIKERIVNKENVKISGFGTFEVKKRGQRIGRNPKTGEEKIIKPRYFVIFRPSKVFKEDINGK
ncbi:MAG: integration host factor subunit alpha [Deferribacterota bacterium]|nr:integration host factor subunit alpha [Deferribacterota bacterium]